MSKIEDKLITKECYAMQDIILENFTREAKWLYYQMDIVKYLKDKGLNLACDYEQKIKDLQSQLDQANARLESAIVPKFEIEQEVYFLPCNDGKEIVVSRDIVIRSYVVKTDNISMIIYALEKSGFYAEEPDLFATFEEAQAKLQELRGGE